MGSYYFNTLLQKLFEYVCFSEKKMQRNLKEVFICGTRPDVIKFAPLILKMKPVVINTGQHRELANEAFEMFDIKPDYDLNLMRDNQTLTDFISRSLFELKRVIDKIKPDRIWVLGDTTTAFVGALIAYLDKIQLVHVEAGLRTGDLNNPFPEELFRTMIDKMSDFLLAPTENNVKNLESEKLKGIIQQTGNLIVDALEIIKENLSDIRPIEEEYILLTMHRRESFGEAMDNVFSVVREFSKKIKVIFPAHPNPNVQASVKKFHIETIQPLNYKDFLWYLKYCKFVMSDSGGVAEEVASFDKSILILRKTTERQEILKSGYAWLSTLEKKDIREKIEMIMKIGKVEYENNPFGDGKSSDKIVEIFKNKQ
jgi:UDP-N-acetylglucosamine 2-epimerase (non-hydrolysing)